MSTSDSLGDSDPMTATLAAISRFLKLELKGPPSNPDSLASPSHEQPVSNAKINDAYTATSSTAVSPASSPELPTAEVSEPGSPLMPVNSDEPAIQDSRDIQKFSQLIHRFLAAFPSHATKDVQSSVPLPVETPGASSECPILATDATASGTSLIESADFQPGHQVAFQSARDSMQWSSPESILDQAAASGNESPWCVLKARLRHASLAGSVIGSPAASTSTFAAYTDDDSISIMMYSPLQPTRYSIVELAEEEFFDADQAQNEQDIPARTPVACGGHEEERTPVEPEFPTPASPYGDHDQLPSEEPPDSSMTKKRRLWVPSEDKISVEAMWWGFRLYLPPPVLQILDDRRIAAAKRGAMIAAALQWLLENIPSVIVPIQLRPMVELLRHLTPFVGYLGIAVTWGWATITSRDEAVFTGAGHGVVLTATWLLPFALIPSAWTLRDESSPRPSIDASQPSAQPIVKEPVIPSVDIPVIESTTQSSVPHEHSPRERTFGSQSTTERQRSCHTQERAAPQHVSEPRQDIKLPQNTESQHNSAPSLPLVPQQIYSHTSTPPLLPGETFCTPLSYYTLLSPHTLSPAPAAPQVVPAPSPYDMDPQPQAVPTATPDTAWSSAPPAAPVPRVIPLPSDDLPVQPPPDKEIGKRSWHTRDSSKHKHRGATKSAEREVFYDAPSPHHDVPASHNISSSDKKFKMLRLKKSKSKRD
ncbi:hypothetical protein FISHEDRAFT_69286 [Fistulina hepatica ATCC 64428]|uniref:Uncharacterized protein n=1 Tax=Fistulina hepatica ATCC 64428 TaxID=1128425 RepID=A0A0D7APA6_9AGAR|nr:hypothetical protein FISHEDRAFT_69286 [Fistulina hepatica ATCC 64428]